MKLNIENLSQEQFDHILDLLIIYKQANKDKNVYLNEKSIKETIHFMNNAGKEMAKQLGVH